MATKEEMLASAAQRKLAKMKYERELENRMAAESGKAPPYRQGERNHRSRIAERDAESFEARREGLDKLRDRGAQEQREAWNELSKKPEIPNIIDDLGGGSLRAALAYTGMRPNRTQEIENELHELRQKDSELAQEKLAQDNRRKAEASAVVMRSAPMALYRSTTKE